MITTTVQKTHHGRYADLIEDKHGLTIKLTEEGHEELYVLLERHTSSPTPSAIWYDWDFVYELLEDFTCNGWSWLHPEDIGALTDCRLILSDDATTEDDGSVTVCGSVWWHERYQIESAVEVLGQTGQLWLQRGEE